MRRFGLIGRTLKHSFSKGYFTEKFQREKRSDHLYELFELDTIAAFPFLLQAHPDLAGLNVTIPYKKEVLAYVDTCDPAVTAIGAANTIRVRNGKLEAFNTDWIGFSDSLLPLLGDERPRALVLGNGGAAAAVCYALQQVGIVYQVVTRSATNGALAYEALTPALVAAHRLVVNTTPLGTWPDVEAYPSLPYEALGPLHLLYDLVYNPEQTAFLRMGQERDTRTKNGYEMLVRQAEAAWEIWNG